MLPQIILFVCIAIISSSVHASPSYTFSYDPTGPGVQNKGIEKWSFDVKDQKQTIPIATSVKNAGGASQFDSVRVAWYPEYALVDGSLDPQAIANMATEISLASQVGSGLPLFLSPSLGTMSPYYLKGKVVDPTKWVLGMEVARDYYIKHFGAEIKFNGPTNEPDNTGGKFNADIFVEVFHLLSGWNTTLQVGACWESPTNAVVWLPTIASSTNLSAATTHSDGRESDSSMLSAYKAFYALAIKENYAQVWNSECHQLAEALVAADLGFSHLLWWDAISEVRGTFMKLARDVNQRLFYGEFGAWGAVASYLDPAEEGSQYIFIGNKDIDNAYTLEFISTTIPVYFDSQGPLYNYTITIPANGEHVIHVTLNATSIVEPKSDVSII